MEQRCCQCCICLSVCQHIVKMFQIACTAGGYDRNINCFCNCTSQFQIIPCLCSVTIHTCQEYLSCSQFFHLMSPLQCINSYINSSTMFVNVPTTAICTFLCIDCYNHTLASKLVCRIRNQIRSING